MSFLPSYPRRCWRSASLIPLAALVTLLVFLLPPTRATGAGDPVIAGAGDIACDPGVSTFNGGLGVPTSCRQKYTSDLLLNLNPSAVFTLGDNQNEDGTLAKYLQSYDPSWGRLKAITHPVAGNHDYLTAGAAGYYAYFGAAAGDPTKGYYSYDLATWHIVVLNSDCGPVGGCDFGSPQETWLKADLAANANKCIVSYWHHPRFSSGKWGDNLYTNAFYEDLYAAHADLAMHGHDHDYERFALQNPSGQPDPLGIREFVSGTGGQNHTEWTTVQPNSEVRNNDTFGVLKLTLHPGSYDWEFVPEPGKTFTDSGSTLCHNASTLTPTPTPVSHASTFTPIADSYVDLANPTANHGTETQLRVDGSPVVRSYLRFDVQGISGTVTHATLRLYANSNLNGGYNAYRVGDNNWGESTINYSNAPTLGDSLGTTGIVVSNTWTTCDVTSYVTGNGSWNLALASTNSTALSLASREATSKPELVVETATDPTPTPTDTATPIPPTATLTDTPPTPTATPIPLITPPGSSGAQNRLYIPFTSE